MDTKVRIQLEPSLVLLSQCHSSWLSLTQTQSNYTSHILNRCSDHLDTGEYLLHFVWSLEGGRDPYFKWIEVSAQCCSSNLSTVRMLGICMSRHSQILFLSERQDLLSPCMILNACVHRLDLGLYSHPNEFWVEELVQMLTLSENNPL